MLRSVLYRDGIAICAKMETMSEAEGRASVKSKDLELQTNFLFWRNRVWEKMPEIR